MKWNDEEIEKAIKESCRILVIERMPTRSELESIGRNDLACKLSKGNEGFRFWANRLKLTLKSSETLRGNKFEEIAFNQLSEMFPNLKITNMNQNHPFDLLAGKHVKIDVKVGELHHFFGTPSYTFRTGKKFGSCDLYLCYGLENGEIKDIFVIPVSEAIVTTLNICIGGKSKYLKYRERWDLVDKLELSNEIATKIS